ncbi:MAG: aminopeptidase P family protein [Candidatus Omnitrophica bacterium]|nr:aminopeptidase P family protein [Candidatus Omnitrophota bacterium]
MPSAAQNGEAMVLIADSERDANLYYATRFLAPDPFIYVQMGGRRILLMSDLEVDRAKAQSRVDEVLSLSQLGRQVKARTQQEPSVLDLVDHLLRERQVKSLTVPATFGVEYADYFRSKGYTLTTKREPLFEQRAVKAEEEIRAIEQTQRATERAVQAAIDIIRESEIRGEELTIGGKPLTAEQIKKVINLHLMQNECVAQHTIVACGVQAVDPHNEGSGVLKAHQPIVMDVFPQHAQSRYYADMTRTVVKGRASDKVKRMQAAVLEGQAIAFQAIRDGADGSLIHQDILDRFTRLGFETGEMGGRMQGFFHGTGHGLGLEVHEPPRISPKRDILKAGMVVTVEPGLYYLDAGGLRIEDLVVVTQNGCRNLTQMPKVLEV